MKTIWRAAGLALAAAVAASLVMAVGPRPAAQFTADGKMLYPKDYRTWVFLSAGMDMAYGENASGPPGAHLFDNVFVDRAAYAHFEKTGRWPEGSAARWRKAPSTSAAASRRTGSRPRCT